MIGKLTKLRALSWRERRLLLQSLLLLPLAWIGLRLFGMAQLYRWAARPGASAKTLRTDVNPQAIGKLIAIAGNHLPFPSTCLTRSLLLVWLLGRLGLRSELRIGVRSIAGRIESHAWVEVAGEPVNDRVDVAESFSVFDGLLPPGARNFS